MKAPGLFSSWQKQLDNADKSLLQLHCKTFVIGFSKEHAWG